MPTQGGQWRFPEKSGILVQQSGYRYENSGDFRKSTIENNGDGVYRHVIKNTGTRFSYWYKDRYGKLVTGTIMK